MINIKGFAREEREQSELERKIGTRFVDKNKDSFSFYINKFVRVMFGGQTFHGCYKGLSENGFLILFPWFEKEYYPNSPKDDNNGACIYHWVESPFFIKTDSVVSVSSLDKRYLDKVVAMGKKYLENIVKNINN